MENLLSKSTPSSDRTTCFNKPGPSMVCSDLTTSMSSSSSVTREGSDKLVLQDAVRGVHIASAADHRLEEGVFKRPQVNEKMIRRRLNRTRKLVTPNSSKALPKSEPSTLSVPPIRNGDDATIINLESPFYASEPHATSESRNVPTHGSVQDWDPIPLSRLRFPTTTQSPLLTAHRSSKKEPDVSATLPAKKQCKLDSGEYVNQTSSHCMAEQKNIDNQVFGKPSRRRKRRSIALEETTVNIPSSSVEFPFSPLVTKTRNYSKLDRTAKLHRLQQSGYGKETAQGRSELKVNKIQSSQQLTLHSFTSSVDSQRKGNVLCSVQVGNASVVNVNVYRVKGHVVNKLL